MTVSAIRSQFRASAKELATEESATDKALIAIDEEAQAKFDEVNNLAKKEVELAKEMIRDAHKDADKERTAIGEWKKAQYAKHSRILLNPTEQFVLVTDSIVTVPLAVTGKVARKGVNMFHNVVNRVNLGFKSEASTKQY